MSMPREDLQLQRYVDGELPAAEAATFAARLLQDHDLRERMEAAEAVRDGFATAAATPSFAAPAGFTANVLSEVRRLPSRQQLQQMDLSESAVKLCRRLLVAAAVLLGLGLAVYGGLFENGNATTLEAAPDEIQSEMDRLDALIRDEMATEHEPPGAPRRGK